MREPLQTQRIPRQRPASPPVPLPGQNGLSTLGARDSAQYKQQKLQESKNILQQQELDLQAYAATVQLHGGPVLRSSDEYGFMSGRARIASGKSNMGNGNGQAVQADGAAGLGVFPLPNRFGVQFEQLQTRIILASPAAAEGGVAP